MRLVFIGLVALLLTACQGSPVIVDYDPSRNFSSYHTWKFANPPVSYQPNNPSLASGLLTSRIEEAVKNALYQHGLNQSSEKADLIVHVWLQVKNHHSQQVITTYNGMSPYPYYPYDTLPYAGYNPAPIFYNGGWGPTISQVNNVNYPVATLQIDLKDSKDDSLVWRGTDVRLWPDSWSSPQESSTWFNEWVARIMAKYPPQ